MVVQPLETAIVRSIDVHVGETVHAGPGAGAARSRPSPPPTSVRRRAQVASLQAQVARMQAEVDNRPFTYTGLDPDLSLQAAIYAQRQSEYHYKLRELQAEGRQPDRQHRSAPRRTRPATSERLAVATDVEKMRKELEQLHVGSQLNTLAAMDNRAEMQRNLASAQQQAAAARRATWRR